MSDMKELLQDMIMGVEYSDKATMPISLYERMKEAIKQLIETRQRLADKQSVLEASRKATIKYKEQFEATRQALDEANADIEANEVSYKERVAKHDLMFNQLRIAKEALKFYADRENTSYDTYSPTWEYWDDGNPDHGRKAKAALASIKE